MKPSCRIAFALSLVPGAWGCTSLAAHEGDHSALVGPKWQLVSITQGGQETALNPSPRSHYSVTFRGEGRALFELACNTGNASWTARASEGRIAIGPIAATRKMCPDMSIAQRMTRGLTGDMGYRISNDDNALELSSGEVTFHFTRATP